LKKKGVIILLSLLLGAFASCAPDRSTFNDESDGGVTEDATPDDSGDISDAYPRDSGINPVDSSYTDSRQGCTKIDILFVIDNSASMDVEQENLTRNFPEFIRAIESYENEDGGRIDYRVGVTSTSPSGVTFHTKIIQKNRGRMCIPDEECPDSRSCECPSMDFAECSAECPYSCFCETAGRVIPGPDRTCSGDDGALIPIPGQEKPWIDGPSDDVISAFTEAATLEASECGVEMPLYAVEHALSQDYQSARFGPNEGFLRPDALLMVIILTDEDDCSSDESDINYEPTTDSLLDAFMGSDQYQYQCTNQDGSDLGDHNQPIEHYIDFLDNLMGSRPRWAAAVIAGMTNCSSAYGDASRAQRLQRFVEAAGQNAIMSDICAGDLASSMDTVLDTLQIACDEYPLI
jgi:hypothetical protein